MKSKEFFNDEIIEIAKKGRLVALKNGKPVICRVDCQCGECEFNGIGCYKQRKEWFESEYIPPLIDLPENLEVDAPILVECMTEWHRRHYAGVDRERKVVYTYPNGRTSWTNNNYDIEEWNHAKLPTKGKEDDEA